jgi:hypothetical protein
VRGALSLCVLGLLAAGCAAADAVMREEAPRSPGSGSFTLYVSNQSFERPEIDIRVEIDGKVVASDEFPVENQHNWIEFRLPLRPGSHVIRASTERGDATLEHTFRVQGKRWAVLDYWCCDDAQDPRFTFEVFRRPVAFA